MVAPPAVGRIGRRVGHQAEELRSAGIDVADAIRDLIGGGLVARPRCASRRPAAGRGVLRVLRRLGLDYPKRLLPGLVRSPFFQAIVLVEYRLVAAKLLFLLPRGAKDSFTPAGSAAKATTARIRMGRLAQNRIDAFAVMASRRRRGPWWGLVVQVFHPSRATLPGQGSENRSESVNHRGHRGAQRRRKSRSIGENRNSCDAPPFCFLPLFFPLCSSVSSVVIIVVLCGD